LVKITWRWGLDVPEAGYETPTWLQQQYLSLNPAALVFQNVLLNGNSGAWPKVGRDTEITIHLGPGFVNEATRSRSNIT